MSTAGDLASGASRMKVQQAPGVRIHVLEGPLEDQVGDQPPRTCNADKALTVRPRRLRGAEGLQHLCSRTCHVCRRKGRSSRGPGERCRHG